MNFTQGAGLSICIQHCLAIPAKSPELQTGPLKKSLFHTQHSFTVILSSWYPHTIFLFSGTNSISVSDFSGLTPSVLISGGLEEPRAIALHPGAGWEIMFLVGFVRFLFHILLMQYRFGFTKRGGIIKKCFLLLPHLFVFVFFALNQHMLGGLIILFCPHILFSSLLSWHKLPAAEIFYSKGLKNE